MKPLHYLALAAASILATSPVMADSHMGGKHEMKSGNIHIQNAYARAVPPGQPNSGAFMTINNMGDSANAVVSASSPAAKVVELHTHTMDGGMMKMRKVEKIDLPAKGKTELKPGGLHIMLIGLKQQLKTGMKVELTLNFADGSSSTITAPVQEVMQSMMGMDHKMDQKMEHNMKH